MKSKNIIFVLILLISLLSFVLADRGFEVKTEYLENSMILSYEFETPSIRQIEDSTYISLNGFSDLLSVGDPVLPVRTTWVLIPVGRSVKDISVDYLNEEKIVSGIPLIADFPLMEGDVFVSQTRSSFSTLSGDYPKNRDYWEINEMRGYQILSLSLYPVHFNSLTNDFYFYKRVEIIINFEREDRNYQTIRSLSSSSQPFDRAVSDFVDNPPVVYSTKYYLSSQQLPSSLSEQKSPYLIITSEEFANYRGSYSFYDLIETKANRFVNPVNGTIVTVENITSNSSFFCDGEYGDGCPSISPALFNDSAAMIRNYIKFAYRNLGAEYVLLGGNITIIPHRSFYIGGLSYTCGSSICTISEHIPSDMYYANLNGSMNANNDSFWGWNGDGVDFLSEVFVGRAPINNVTELSNFVQKTILFENLTREKSLFTRNVFNTYEAEIDNLEVISSYFSLKGFNVSRTPLNSPNILTYLNGFSISEELPAIINHAGHGGYNVLTGFGLFTPAIFNQYPNFLYSQACSWGAYDFSNSLAVKLVNTQNMSFAILANSRYGWYYKNACGPGCIFMREFWYQVLYNRVGNLGRANQISKINKMNSAGVYSRWTYWTQNLLGDPEVSFYYYPFYDGFDVLVLSPISEKYYPNQSILVNFTMQNLSHYANINWSLGNQNYNETSIGEYISFPEGNHTIFVMARGNGDNLAYKNFTFFVDLTPPTYENQTAEGIFKRNKLVNFSLINSLDNFGISEQILETNITGTTKNYTLVRNASSENVFILSSESSFLLNLTSFEDSFSYRFYLVDFAGNINVSEMQTINIENSLPVLSLDKQNYTLMTTAELNLNLSDIFTDIDLDILSFRVLSFENISYSISNNLLNISTPTNFVTSGSIKIGVNDTKEESNFTLFFNFLPVSLSSSDFDGNTTNISLLESYTMVPLILERSGYGKIEFDSVNLTVPEISSAIVNISTNKVFVNTSYALGLNSSANISLKLGSNIAKYCTDLEWHVAGKDYTPVIYKSQNFLSGDSVCRDCVILSCSGGNFIFRVSGFSAYEVKSASCSDGIRNQNEVGVDCGGVCSSCPSANTGGGGGSSKSSINNFSNILINVTNMTINSSEELSSDDIVNVSATDDTVDSSCIGFSFFWNKFNLLSLVLLVVLFFVIVFLLVKKPKRRKKFS